MFTKKLLEVSSNALSTYPDLKVNRDMVMDNLINRPYNIISAKLPDLETANTISVETLETLTRKDASTYNEATDFAVATLTELFNKTINVVCRGEILPLIKNLSDKIYTLTEGIQYSPLEIVPVDLLYFNYPLVEGELDNALSIKGNIDGGIIRRYNGVFADMSEGALMELIKSKGMQNDAGFKHLLNTLEPSFIHNAFQIGFRNAAFDTYPLNEVIVNDAYRTNQQIGIKHNVVGANVVAVIYMLCLVLHDDPQERTSGTIGDYNSYIASVKRAASIVLRDVMTMMNDNNSRVIVGSFVSNDITYIVVNEQQFARLVKAGGNVESIIGTTMANIVNPTIEVLVENKDKLTKAYNDTHTFNLNKLNSSNYNQKKQIFLQQMSEHKLSHNVIPESFNSPLEISMAILGNLPPHSATYLGKSSVLFDNMVDTFVSKLLEYQRDINDVTNNEIVIKVLVELVCELVTSKGTLNV